MEEASEEWARRETASSIAKSLERVEAKEKAAAQASLPPKASAAHAASLVRHAAPQDSGEAPELLKGWLVRKNEGLFGRVQRRLFCLTPSVLKYTERPSGEDTEWECLPLRDFVSIELEDVDLHLVLKDRTVTITAVTASEALNWAQALKEAAHIPVRLSNSALQMLQEGMGMDSALVQAGDDPASRSARADLVALLDDMRSSQKAFAASSVVMAGFLFKMRSHAPRVWQKRCACQAMALGFI